MQRAAPSRCGGAGEGRSRVPAAWARAGAAPRAVGAPGAARRAARSRAAHTCRAGGSGGGSGGAAYGLFVCSGSPAIAEAACHSGLDFVVIDAQHGAVSYSSEGAGLGGGGRGTRAPPWRGCSNNECAPPAAPHPIPTQHPSSPAPARPHPPTPLPGSTARPSGGDVGGPREAHRARGRPRRPLRHAAGARVSSAAAGAAPKEGWRPWVAGGPGNRAGRPPALHAARAVAAPRPPRPRPRSAPRPQPRRRRRDGAVGAHPRGGGARGVVLQVPTPGPAQRGVPRAVSMPHPGPARGGARGRPGARRRRPLVEAARQPRRAGRPPRPRPSPPRRLPRARPLARRAVYKKGVGPAALGAYLRDANQETEVGALVWGPAAPRPVPRARRLCPQPHLHPPPPHQTPTPATPPQPHQPHPTPPPPPPPPHQPLPTPRCGSRSRPRRRWRTSITSWRCQASAVPSSVCGQAGGSGLSAWGPEAPAAPACRRGAGRRHPSHSTGAPATPAAAGAQAPRTWASPTAST
jgi:hypothetical protein